MVGGLENVVVHLTAHQQLSGTFSKDHTHTFLLSFWFVLKI